MNNWQRLLAPTHWAFGKTQEECLTEYRTRRADLVATMKGGGIDRLRRESANDAVLMRGLAGLST